MSNDLLFQLAAETKRVADLGFMACTAGNSSVLLESDPLVVAMSPSGHDKTKLVPESFIRVGVDGRQSPERWRDKPGRDQTRRGSRANVLM